MSTLSHVAGLPCSLAEAPLATSSTMVPKAASPAIYPARNAQALVPAFGVESNEHDRDDRDRAQPNTDAERQNLADRLSHWVKFRA